MRPSQLLIVLALLVLVLLDSPFGGQPSLITDFFVLFGSVVVESLPFLVLGSLISAGIHVLVPSKSLLRWLPKRIGFKQLSILGIGFVFPVCECGNVPLSRSLIRKGLSVPDAVMLLVAAPILNPVTLITTHQAFRTEPIVLIGRIAGAVACALLVRLFLRKYTAASLLTPNFAATCTAEHSHATHARSISQRCSSFALQFSQDLRSLFPALMLGSGVAAGLQVLVPRNTLLDIAATPLLAIGIMMLLAFVISICANVDAFFALALAGIFPVSAILAFLILGPIVDIKMLSLMRTSFSRQTMLAICIIVAITTLTISLGVQYAY